MSETDWGQSHVWVRIMAVVLTLLCATVRSQARPPAPPDFGPNVLIFDPSMPTAAIQSKLDAVFQAQERNQFGPERYAVFFKPGHYALDVNVGFYTQVLGLGAMPDDVSIAGAVHSDANWLGNGNATCNFWRACENLAVTPPDATPIHWAVSQGTDLRRMHVRGNLNLWDRGWSSGGFLADSKIDGEVKSGSQQQWFSRNAEWGDWTGHNWNMMFVGVDHPPAGDWPRPPYTVIANTPVIREKPYLFLDRAGNYAVRVPALHTGGTQGTSWASGETAGATVPLDKFYLAQAGKDTAASINAALQEGKNLLLTPGIYHLDSSLRVTRPGTIVLGLGFATLIPDKGTPALTVSDVDGVTVGGIIFDAGPVESPTLLQVGDGGQRAGPCEEPHVPVRHRLPGGRGDGRDDVVLRPHQQQPCRGRQPLDLAGGPWRGRDLERQPEQKRHHRQRQDVTLYGLFVEHFQEYQTLWNGDGGRLYFYQSELPYDAPTQSEWQHDGVNGFASYKVADGVKSHEAWGLGIYGVFIHSPTLCANAIEAPTAPGIGLHHMTAIWITGKPESEITHVINGMGETVNRANHKATVDHS